MPRVKIRKLRIEAVELSIFPISLILQQIPQLQNKKILGLNPSLFKNLNSMYGIESRKKHSLMLRYHNLAENQHEDLLSRIFPLKQKKFTGFPFSASLVEFCNEGFWINLLTKKTAELIDASFIDADIDQLFVEIFGVVNWQGNQIDTRRIMDILYKFMMKPRNIEFTIHFIKDLYETQKSISSLLFIEEMQIK